MPLMGLAIGGGAGLLKSELIDIPAQERALKLQAAIARYSPWTHMQAHPENVPTPNPFSSALQFGAAGAMMGMGADRAKLDEAMANRLNSGGNLFGTGSPLASAPGGANPMTSLNSNGGIVGDYSSWTGLGSGGGMGPSGMYNDTYGGWKPMSSPGDYYWQNK